MAQRHRGGTTGQRLYACIVASMCLRSCKRRDVRDPKPVHRRHPENREGSHGGEAPEYGPHRPNSGVRSREGSFLLEMATARDYSRPEPSFFIKIPSC